jgi:hypothetical protein
MQALKDRIKNLIFYFECSFNPSKYTKDTYTLDYENKVYREDELVKIIRGAMPHFALTQEEFNEFSSKADIDEMLRTAWGRVSKARKDSKGDYGELLLFLILLVYYKSPKFVTKVRLRTTLKDQLKGFDCAHFTIEGEEVCLWLGEAKFHKSFSTAISDAIKSLKAHCEYGYLNDEITILRSNIEINSHFKDYDLLVQALRGRSLDKLNFRIPILLTYDSKCVQTNCDLDQKFKSAMLNELSQLYQTIESCDITARSNFKFIFILFPLKSVETIKSKLEMTEEVSR